MVLDRKITKGLIWLTEQRSCDIYKPPNNDSSKISEFQRDMFTQSYGWDFIYIPISLMQFYVLYTNIIFFEYSWIEMPSSITRIAVSHY
jgi:hypothetical protein